MRKHLLKWGYYRYQQLVNGRWMDLKRECNGMLRPSVYKAIYHVAKDAEDLDILEIGGAHGASTIALAEGMEDSRKSSRLVMVERCERGSRARYGSYAENWAILTGNLKRYGVEKRVRTHLHGITDDSVGAVKSLFTTENLAGFMHDADGDLGRDFQAFWPLVIPGGFIIVDDYPRSSDTDHEKKLRTYYLLNRLMTWGLFEPQRRICDTIIGRKPVNADWSRFDRESLERLGSNELAPNIG